jgi:hypothetical protein
VRGRDALASAVLGALVNFPWEWAHSVLYRGVPGFTWREHLVCCGLAALADGVGIGVIFGIGAIAFRDPHWTEHPAPARLGLVALLGLIGAVLTERLALSLGWWGYGPTMPRVPGTGLGLTPLVQFVLLPLVVLFWILPHRWRAERRLNLHGAPADSPVNE